MEPYWGRPDHFRFRTPRNALGLRLAYSAILIAKRGGNLRSVMHRRCTNATVERARNFAPRPHSAHQPQFLLVRTEHYNFKILSPPLLGQARGIGIQAQIRRDENRPIAKHHRRRRLARKPLKIGGTLALRPRDQGPTTKSLPSACGLLRRMLQFPLLQGRICGECRIPSSSLLWPRAPAVVSFAK